MLEKGVEARDILQQGMISAMEVIGEKFKVGDVFIPEVLLSARTMNEGCIRSGTLSCHRGTGSERQSFDRARSKVIIMISGKIS